MGYGALLLGSLGVGLLWRGYWASGAAALGVGVLLAASEVREAGRGRKIARSEESDNA